MKIERLENEAFKENLEKTKDERKKKLNLLQFLQKKIANFKKLYCLLEVFVDGQKLLKLCKVNQSYLKELLFYWTRVERTLQKIFPSELDLKIKH